MMHVSVAIPAQHRPLLRNAVDPVAEDRNTTVINLSGLGNGEVPGKVASVASIRTAGTWNRSTTVGLLVVTAVGCCVAYWTFGRPIFGSTSHGNAGPVAGTSGSSGRIINWAWIDQVMRKSYG